MNCVNFIEALADQGHKVHCGPAVLLPELSRGDITHLGCAQGSDNWENLWDTFPSQPQTASSSGSAGLETNSVYLDTLILISRCS